METVRVDYESKGVKFFYIYKALAHPENNGYIQPFTLKERLLHVKEAQRTLGSGFQWIADNMENDLKHKLGNAPNSEFIVDPEGKIVRKRSWSKPDQVRSDLEELIGPVARVTKVSDLDLKRELPPKVAAKGVVPRIKVPSGLQAVKVTPKASTEPYYVKLRAEVESSLMSRGEGKLYLGFHIDPLYNVHWNNLAAPVTYEIVSGAKADPPKGTGPKVAEESDADPREFLVDVSGVGKSAIEVKVQYFACNDDEGWCKPVTQYYDVELQRDPDAGRPQGRGRPSGLAGRPSGRPGNNPGGRPQAGRDVVPGRIVSIEGNVLTIMTRDRKQRSFRLTESTQVGRNRQRSSAKELQKGDRCMVGFDPKDKSSDMPAVLRIMARSE